MEVQKKANAILLLFDSTFRTYCINELYILVKVSGKLHASLTKVYDGKSHLVSEFASKQEVIDVSAVQTL